MKKRFLTSVIILIAIRLSTAQDDSLALRILFEIGEKGDQPGQFNRPLGVAADANGNIYVADTGNNRIQKFNATGGLEKFVGGFGWEKEQFQLPHDIFVYNSLDVYVADNENSRIQRFDKDLNWLTSYYSNDNWETKYQFEFPRSLFVSLHGEIFIIDSQNDRITKFNSAFEPQLTFGDFDWGQGVLQNPSHISISNKDIIYVSDSDAGKIRVYDYFGNFLQDIGDGILESPKGISIHSAGYIFVADSKMNQIVAFDQTGRLLLKLGSTGEKLGAFSEPFDVDVERNRLLVADASNHRIQVFELFRTH